MFSLLGGKCSLEVKLFLLVCQRSSFKSDTCVKSCVSLNSSALLQHQCQASSSPTSFSNLVVQVYVLELWRHHCPVCSQGLTYLPFSSPENARTGASVVITYFKTRKNS